MASFYVVIFATILFGVVTVSFVRIILSEATQSSNDDLSRSAYDSAIAGVEDAKTAVNRYYSCINGTGNAGDCGEQERAKLFSQNCTQEGIGVARYLYGDNYKGGPDDTEVKIQETGVSDAESGSDQAYTCVIVSDEVPDYRGTLTKDTPAKVIPIAVNDGTGNQTTQIEKVRTIRFGWYSQLNEGNRSDFILSGGRLKSQNGRGENGPTIPPTIALTFIRMKAGMSIEDFHTPNNGSDYATMLLLPSGQTGANETYVEEIFYGALREVGNISKSGSNYPFAVTCSTASEFACTVDITGLTFEAGDSVFLVVSLPYSNTESVDFAAVLYDINAEPVKFVGVQIQVDSTGRTNQLFRRVEARLDPIDLFFPFPQYELFVDGDGDQSVDKNFWITANCWHTHPLDNGNTDNKPKFCPNNGSLDDI